MLEFGKLSQVTKTYNKELGILRGQNFDEIKFRRAESSAGKDKAEKAGDSFEAFLEEKMIFSNKLAEKLGLTTTGFIQFNDGERDAEGAITKVTDVYFMHVEDTHDECKLLKSTNKGAKKSLSIKAPILFADLIAAGVIDATKTKNQYLKLVPVEVSNSPADVKGWFKVVVDTSVDETVEDDDDDSVDVLKNSTAENASNDF